MSIRTRFEIETFVLGAHPTPARKAQALMADLLQARAEDHPDLPVLEAAYADFAKEHDVTALLNNMEAEEEEYWVKRLGRLAAIDILTIGKVQPEHMSYMASLSDDAFAACVKTATSMAKELNDSVQQIEAELGSDLVD
jgi:hypothetical protein